MENTKTLLEYLDETLKKGGNKEIYKIDLELVRSFKLETLTGTDAQLMAVMSALRTSVTAVMLGLGLGGDIEDSADELDMYEEEMKEKKHRYDA